MQGEIGLDGFQDSYYRNFAYAMITVFSVFIVLILFNLLIALMTEAYEDVKTERAKIIVELELEEAIISPAMSRNDAKKVPNICTS